ncbi:sel1 repeat family protein [Alteromonas aestuariivivens]|uniref:Sel1 repeat family protein n=1 Tax=Alteromonas aestuariivivens TaxID=1938339 RepID=A0A3D8MES3_9ALTE|nr:SEL1-like repeat protein [Alteromonas aestuariivivens]RDV29116.1 sel1 repeat family protein [Alteromonas aestuariivivens]
MNFIGKSLISALAVALPFQAASVNLLKANTEFKNQQYQQAFSLYEEGARVGSAHAYYQLGVMYSKGLAVQADTLTSLVYFALAAEQKYHNAETVVKNMLANLNEEELSDINQLLEEYVAEQHQIQQQYLPAINPKNLDYKVTFEGKTALEQKFHPETLDDEPFEDFYSGDDEEEDLDSNGLIITEQPGFLVVENDVAADGSVRYISEVQKSGSVRRYVDSYKLFPLEKPDLNGKPVEFVNRAYLGVAASDKFQLIEELPRLYGETRKIIRAAEQSESLEDQYQYAMAMIMFPWLEEQPNQARELLKQLAIQGHPSAMYEYGLQLYMAQEDIPEAVKWITEASKFGLARAEYRLGKLLLTSPWVIHDESKALFWFESAMQKSHEAAALHAAHIKLTAKNQQLRDVEGAIQYLSRVEATQGLNPEYYYLLALSYKDRPDRDYKLAFQNLEKAIFMAGQANWDTSEWEGLLAKLLQGNITVTDFESP